MSEYRHSGSCHCGAIGVGLRTQRAPLEQVLGACQCTFCRKHNARAFTDPGGEVTINVREPEHLNRYAFGLRTADVILCRRCGVYIGMVLEEGGRAWSTINIDTLDDRAAFVRSTEARDYSAEDAAGRIARRKARWTPTVLVGWPAAKTE